MVEPRRLSRGGLVQTDASSSRRLFGLNSRSISSSSCDLETASSVLEKRPGSVQGKWEDIGSRLAQLINSERETQPSTSVSHADGAAHEISGGLSVDHIVHSLLDDPALPNLLSEFDPNSPLLDSGFELSKQIGAQKRNTPGAVRGLSAQTLRGSKLNSVTGRSHAGTLRGSEDGSEIVDTLCESLTTSDDSPPVPSSVIPENTTCKRRKVAHGGVQASDQTRSSTSGASASPVPASMTLLSHSPGQAKSTRTSLIGREHELPGNHEMDVFLRRLHASPLK